MTTDAAPPAGATPALTELGFYALAGHSDSPRDCIDQARDAEAIGLGSAFISERFNVKDAGVLSGAIGAATETLGIATGATNHNTRHVMVTATMATTMHRLTGGRFGLGLGRGFGFLNDIMGLRHVTSAQLVDAIGIYRRLWHGEMVAGHQGPAGSYPLLMQDPTFDEHIPVLLTAMGPKTLELAGSIADGVILHTFFSDEALARCVATIRRGAEEAGRDPASVRIWSVLATVTDDIDEDLRLRKLAGRLATYCQAYGDLMVSVNGWDPADLDRLRADEVVASMTGAIDAVATTEQLAHIDTVIPDEWLAASATGSAADCAARMAGQFDLGADSVILHGATPGELAAVVEAYRAVRPATTAAADLPANPGWITTPGS